MEVQKPPLNFCATTPASPTVNAPRFTPAGTGDRPKHTAPQEIPASAPPPPVFTPGGRLWVGLKPAPFSEFYCHRTDAPRPVRGPPLPGGQGKPLRACAASPPHVSGKTGWTRPPCTRGRKDGGWGGTDLGERALHAVSCDDDAVPLVGAPALEELPGQAALHHARGGHHHAGTDVVEVIHALGQRRAGGTVSDPSFDKAPVFVQSDRVTESKGQGRSHSCRGLTRPGNRRSRSRVPERCGLGVK